MVMGRGLPVSVRAARKEALRKDPTARVGQAGAGARSASPAPWSTWFSGGTDRPGKGLLRRSAHHGNHSARAAPVHSPPRALPGQLAHGEYNRSPGPRSSSLAPAAPRLRAQQLPDVAVGRTGSPGAARHRAAVPVRRSGTGPSDMGMRCPPPAAAAQRTPDPAAGTLTDPSIKARALRQFAWARAGDAQPRAGSYATARTPSPSAAPGWPEIMSRFRPAAFAA